MPSTKKRINLTVPDELYIAIKAYMQEKGLHCFATACLSIIHQYLDCEGFILHDDSFLYDSF